MTTTPAPEAGTRLLVLINGVYVNLTNCTWSVLYGPVCNTDLIHDLAVTPVDSTTLETWVIALIAVLSVLFFVVMGVLIWAFCRKKKEMEGFDPVPQAPPGYPPQAPPGYPAAYGRPLGAPVTPRVISVALVRPCGDAGC